MILTDEEMERLTSYKRGHEQAKFLEGYGLRPFLTREGQCRVTWEAVTQAMVQNQNQPVSQPNWQAIRKRA